MRRSRIFATVVAGAVALTASVAGAADGDIRFHKTNVCGPDHGRYFDSEVSTRANCKYNRLCGNDVFRSVWVNSTVRPGTKIRVWDSPDGSTRDDWAEITIKAIRQNFYGKREGRNGMCIDSFETIRSGSDYQVYYRRVNGLDGKVSLVQIIPAR